MPTLSELPEDKRKEVARALAQSAFAVIDKPDGPGANDPPSKRLFALLADAGPAHEKEFYGNGFSAARGALVDQEFDKIHSEALEHAKTYDECIKPLQETEPNFALPSATLVRMWCLSHFTRALCKEDSPFANLELAEEIDDEDLEEEESDEEESEEEDEDYSDGDDVIVLTSDESESDDEERERKKRKRERKKKRQERLATSDDEEEEEEEEEEEK